MPRNPTATFLQKFIVRSTDAIRGDDAATGLGGPLTLKAGDSLGGSGDGGPAFLIGGEADPGGDPGNAGVQTGGPITLFTPRTTPIFSFLVAADTVAGTAEGARLRVFGATASAGGEVVVETGNASPSSTLDGGTFEVDCGNGDDTGDGGGIRMLAGIGGPAGSPGAVAIKGGGAPISSLPGGVQIDGAAFPFTAGASLALTAATPSIGGVATLSGGAGLIGGGLPGGAVTVTGGPGDVAGAGGSVSVSGGASSIGLGGSVSVAAGSGTPQGVVNLDGPLGRDAMAYKYGFIPVSSGLTGSTGPLIYGVGPLAAYTPMTGGPGPIIMTASWAHPAGPPLAPPTALIIHSISAVGFAIDWTPFTTTTPYELHWVARL